MPRNYSAIHPFLSSETSYKMIVLSLLKNVISLKPFPFNIIGSPYVQPAGDLGAMGSGMSVEHGLMEMLLLTEE